MSDIYYSPVESIPEYLIRTPKMQLKLQSPKLQSPKIQSLKMQSPKLQSPRIQLKVQSPKKILRTFLQNTIDDSTHIRTFSFPINNILRTLH